MTISATYDSTLSRVRLSGIVPSIYDTFNRNVVTGWGTADSGQIWATNLPNEFSVDGAEGDIDINGFGPRTAFLDIGKENIDLAVLTSPSVTGSGDTIFQILRGRYVSGSEYYQAQAEYDVNSTASLALIAGSTFLNRVTIGNYSAGDEFWLRLQILFSRIRAKMWPATDIEPDLWTIDVTDITVTGTGDLLLWAELGAGNTNTQPVNVSFDALAMQGDGIVERSTDQINWTVVRGGLDVGIAGTSFAVDDYEFIPGVINYYRISLVEPESGVIFDSDTTSITPVITSVWLKSIYHPFLNRQIDILRDFDKVSRGFRGNVYDVIGRSLPVAVTDLRQSREWTLEICVHGDQNASAVDIMLASGDPLFLHIPSDSNLPIPSMHIAVNQNASMLKRAYSDTRIWTLPFREIAAPDASIVGATATWQTVLNLYGTWQDVLNAHPTWSDLLELIASPEDLVLP